MLDFTVFFFCWMASYISAGLRGWTTGTATYFLFFRFVAHQMLCLGIFVMYHLCSIDTTILYYFVFMNMLSFSCVANQA